MSPVYPTREAFHNLAKQGNIVPVYREIVADMDTPVSAFKKLADHTDNVFLLESVEGGEKFARYSFIGINPFMIFKSFKKRIEISYANGKLETFSHPSPLDKLKEIMVAYKPVIVPELPPFAGGAVGYITYDEVKNFEPVGDRPKDELNVPGMCFAITDNLVVFDHFKHKMKLVVNCHISDDTNIDVAYDEALKKIDSMHRKLVQSISYSAKTKTPHKPGITSNFTEESFKQAVEKCKTYITAGDAFQIVLSQRFQTEISCDPFEIYRALRHINPSPYMFYLKFNELTLAGASPEVLVKVENETVQVRPIAGTRKRGETTEEDIALEKDLLADPKEVAEHVMLVDLGRNDVGRVSEYGTVRVDDFMVVERYSHVMHIVSNVKGKLAKGKDVFDVFKACFPAGTLSGAPKIRAMQIIDEIETVNRATYGGSVCTFSFDGNLNSCITIRTVLVKDGTAYVQSGAGVVADSDPQAEYQETINKAMATMKAIEVAECGLEY